MIAERPNDVVHRPRSSQSQPLTRSRRLAACRVEAKVKRQKQAKARQGTQPRTGTQTGQSSTAACNAAEEERTLGQARKQATRPGTTGSRNKAMDKGEV